MAACQSPRKGRSEPETHAGIRALGVLDLVFTPRLRRAFRHGKTGTNEREVDGGNQSMKFGKTPALR